MVPLIDTFFLLLAFFISSVLTLQVARGIPLDLPKAGSSQAIPKENRLTVTIGPGEQVQLEERWMSLEQMRNQLASHPRRDSLQVGLRAEPATPYERVIEVLASVRESGIGRVTLWISPKLKQKRLVR